MINPQPNRRNFLKGLMSGVALAGIGAGTANAATLNNNRLVVIFTRGGWDSMGVVQPLGAPEYDDLNQGVISKTNSHNLDGFFALHQNLNFHKNLYDAGQLSIYHAAGWPTLTRSHFDAQRLIENGDSQIGQVTGLQSGWLNRASAALDPGNPRIALSSKQQVPFMLKGIHPVGSIGGSLPGDGDTSNFRTLLDWQYAANVPVHTALMEAITNNNNLNEIASESTNGTSTNVSQLESYIRGKYNSTHERQAATVGLAMAPNNGYRISQIDLANWDHHKDLNSGLFSRTTQLDNVMAALRAELGDTWNNTVVITVSEFGRQVKVNAGLGRDHGTGQCMFISGGAVNGGSVKLADDTWPGLAPEQLVNYSNESGGGKQDSLRATLDIRKAFVAGLMHVGLSLEEARAVFPEATAVQPLSL